MCWIQAICLQFWAIRFTRTVGANVKEKGVGYVTRFHVKKSFMDRYQIQQVGGSSHTEWWVPAEELEALNDNIVGLIEVIGEYR